MKITRTTSPPLPSPAIHLICSICTTAAQHKRKRGYPPPSAVSHCSPQRTHTTKTRHKQLIKPYRCTTAVCTAQACDHKTASTTGKQTHPRIMISRDDDPVGTVCAIVLNWGGKNTKNERRRDYTKGAKGVWGGGVKGSRGGGHRKNENRRDKKRVKRKQAFYNGTKQPQTNTRRMMLNRPRETTSLFYPHTTKQKQILFILSHSSFTRQKTTRFTKDEQNNRRQPPCCRRCRHPYSI